jgi:hypothetical protein
VIYHILENIYRRAGWRCWFGLPRRSRSDNRERKQEESAAESCRILHQFLPNQIERSPRETMYENIKALSQKFSADNRLLLCLLICL